MAEWNQTNSGTQGGSPETATPATTTNAGKQAPAVNPKNKKKLTFIVAGTGVFVLTAGILFQIFRPDPGAATEQKEDTARSQSSSRYLARVNGELISWDEIAQECVFRYGPEVLDNVINRKIVHQACKEHNITVTDQEVANEIKTIAGRFKMPVETWYEMLAAERKLTPQQYQRDVIWPMLALKKLAGENITITDAELQKAFIRDYGLKVKARVIMFDNYRRAMETFEELRRNPKDFEKLAREKSIEPNSRALDGSIPPIHRFYSNPKLEEVAFKLRQGEISGVIDIGNGRYVIMKCDGFSEPIVTDIEEVRADLHSHLLEERVQQSVNRVFSKLRAEARVDNYLTNKTNQAVDYSDGATKNKVTPASGVYPKSASSKAEKKPF